jgi:hypothetical protein
LDDAREPAPAPIGRSQLAVAAVLALWACLSVLAMTRHGAGTTVDSGEYLSVAHNVAGGKGFTMPYASYDEAYPERPAPSLRIPMTQFPPAFPAVVAAGERLTGARPTDVARWVNALALAGTVATVALLVYAATGALLWEVAAGALLVRPPLVFAHARLLSEPLALLSLAVVVAAAHAYLRRPRRRTLVLMSVAAAAGALTRLPGVVPAVCAAAAIALWSHGSARRRATRAAAVLAASLLPLAGWLARNAVVAGHASDKRLGLHPPSVKVWRQAADKLLAWIGPHHLPWVVVTIVVVGALVAWAGRAAWRARDTRAARQRPSLPAMCLGLAAAYVAFVVAVRTFVDNNLSFGSRMFLPVLLLGTIAVTSGASALRAGPRVAVAAVCAGVWATATIALVGTNIPQFPTSSSAGYAAKTWRSSPTVALVARLDTDVAVVTNAPDPIWLYTGKNPLFIPLGRDLYSGRPNPRYDEEVRALRSALRGRRAVVAFFDHPTRSPYSRVIDVRLRDALGLTSSVRYTDATVYAVG